MKQAQPVYQCPLCGRTTPNTHDIEHEHCACCGMPGLPKCCEHDPDGSRQMARLAELDRALYRLSGL